MPLLKEGDQEKVACYTCNAFVTVTYAHRDVPFSDGSGTVKNTLVGICMECNSICVLTSSINYKGG